MKTIPEKSSSILICALLAAVTLAVYWPVHSFEFVKYDDDKYITDNRNVLQGLSLQNIRWAFTTGTASNWHPVTWLSHMLDVELFGLENPGAHHLVNLAFHIINSLLLFLLLKSITSAIWPAAFIAALFAMHPLHIESVAWAAERKDVLSTFFMLLTLAVYTGYTISPSLYRYMLSLVLFAMGLMAKPMLVTLPFLLLLLDYWPLERLKLGTGDIAADNKKSLKRPKLILEKIPFLVLSIASSIITFLVQRTGGAMSNMDVFSAKVRIFNSAVAYFEYIKKMVWPANLAVLYPHPGDNVSTAKAVTWIILLAGLTALILYYARRKKYLAAGWFWYLGALVPVIGLVQVGVQSMADRYTYIPLIGLFIIIAFALRDITEKLPKLKYPIAIAAYLILFFLSAVTSSQLKYWRNSKSLFEHTLAVTKDNYFMHNNYANLLSDEDKNELAAMHFQKALSIRSRYPEIHNNYANVLSDLGRTDDAIAHYQIALKLDPDFSSAHYNYGNVLLRKGLTDQSVQQYQLAVKSDPANADAHGMLGYCLAQQGQYEQAIKQYETALEYSPDNVITHGRLGLALAAKGDIDNAIKQFQYVIDKRPEDYEMYCNIGIMLDSKGLTDLAIENFKKALRIKPEYKDAQNCLDAALKKQKKN